MSTDPRHMPNYLIQNGLDLSNLDKTGSVLEIHSDYQDYDVTGPESAGNADGENIIDTLGEPINVSFKELAKDMHSLDDSGHVKKKILEEGGGEVIEEGCTVGIGYSAYWEWEKKPFDSRSPIKPLEYNMSESAVLPGLQMAVSSMRVGEVSLFLLSYHVMYGKMGNPPHIKPAADCVFYVKLVRSQLTPDVRASMMEENMFTRYLTECKRLFKNGSHFFESNNIRMAIRCFNKAVNMMHHTRLANEEEERRQEKFLLKLYLNLATCYNHSKNPRRACCMCNEIHRLQNIWSNGKALYQNAKALRMLGEFNAAEKKLKRALQLCPDMRTSIEKEIKTVTVQREAYSKSELFASQNVSEQRERKTEEFKAEIDTLVEQFMADENICTIALPKTLNSEELKYIQDISEQFKIGCHLINKDMSLDKTPREPKP